MKCSDWVGGGWTRTQFAYVTRRWTDFPVIVCYSCTAPPLINQYPTYRCVDTAAAPKVFAFILTASSEHSAVPDPNISTSILLFFHQIRHPNYLLSNTECVAHSTDRGICGRWGWDGAKAKGICWACHSDGEGGNERQPLCLFNFREVWINMQIEIWEFSFRAHRQTIPLVFLGGLISIVSITPASGPRLAWWSNYNSA